jgi:uncharacterized protein (TIRG00374 family)
MKKRLVSVVVSCLLLGLIYWKIDRTQLWEAMRRADPAWLLGSISMFVPLTMVSAWRLHRLAFRHEALDFAESARLTLVASTLNLVLPSKMGDVLKAVFMQRKAGMEGALPWALVIFEKGCDMLSLWFWAVLACLFLGSVYVWALPAGILIGMGLVFGIALLMSRRTCETLFKILAAAPLPAKFQGKLGALRESLNYLRMELRGRPARVVEVAMISAALWFFHLLQIWMFTLALGAEVPVLDNMALAALGILAGLLPLTFAGVGTRDAAVIYLYAPFMNSGAAAVLGLLCTSRYLMPALVGVPFLSREIITLAAARKTGQTA